jgi:hypothetical protein
MTGTGFEVGTKNGDVVLILTVADDDTGGITAVGLPMAPDDAKALVNAVGSAIKEVSRVMT